jgi:hypothetical protein
MDLLSDLEQPIDSFTARTSAQRTATFRANDPARAIGQRTKYRHDNSKHETDASYLSRPFIVWDGEGVTGTDGVHRYVMLAVKSPTDSDYLGNVHGLGTVESFEMVLTFAENNPGGIHVIYGGGYDFNMMMRDIPRDDVQRIYKQKYHQWGGYRIGWRPGKSFYIARVDAQGKTIGKGVTVYDVVSFFQCPFVKACDAYLGDKFSNRDMIVNNKALRSSFTAADIPDVRKYNAAELDNLMALMIELRSRLNRAGLRPRRWDGPGAVASALLLREKVKASQTDTPKRVAKAARFAYAGGRFEVLRFGDVHETVWEYDVNSAYPTALAQVPDLTAGKWKHFDGDPGPHHYALYHVEYQGKNPELPGALFRRDANGTVSYPMALTGWYWSPEIETAREYCARGYGEIRVIEAHVFIEKDPDVRPFHFIEPLYNKRRALKKAGDGAHVGIKLALNSLYGKCAQQVGWEIKEDGELRIPPFHQLEWAGYATSWCRAAVLRAVLDNLADVVAFETDAVFVTCPLDVNCGSNLGDFELVAFDNMTYVQSGMYFADSEGKAIVKTRGVDRCKCPSSVDVCECGSLTRALVREKIALPCAEDRVVIAKLTRFIGVGVALAQTWDKWRSWETMVKHMTLEPSGKRVHLGCACMTLRYDETGKLLNAGIASEVWHTTECPLQNAAHSAEFPIAWINPDPAMSTLEELRNVVTDYE